MSYAYDKKSKKCTYLSEFDNIIQRIVSIIVSICELSNLSSNNYYGQANWGHIHKDKLCFVATFMYKYNHLISTNM